MKKIAALVLVIALISSMVFSGCASSEVSTPSESGSASASEEGGETPSEAEPIELTEILTSGHISMNVGLPLYVGEKYDMYKGIGLNAPRTHYVSGPPQLEALPSGAWDVGWIGITAANTGILQYGVKIIGVGGIDSSHKMFVREDSDIYQAGKGNFEDCPEVYGTVETWRGKDILCEKGTLHYLNLMLALEKFGLTENDVNIIHMDAPSALQAFKAGDGDVLVTYSNTTIEAYAAGFKVVETMAQIGAAMPGVIISTPEYLENNKDIVADYLKASIEAMQFIKDPANLEDCTMLYQQFVSEEGGTELSYEEAEATMEMYDWMSIEDFKALCEIGSDGLSGLQNLYGSIFDNYVSLGLCEIEDKDTIINAIDITYLEQALADF